MSEPVLHQAGEGARIDLGPMGEGRTKIGAKETDDAFGAWEFVVDGSGGAPPPHIHNTIHEVMVLLEGEGEFVVGDRTERLTPGGFLYAPPGTVHGVSPTGGGSVRVLIFASPASTHEAVIEAITKLAISGPPDPARIAEFLADADIEIPAPPA